MYFETIYRILSKIQLVAFLLSSLHTFRNGKLIFALSFINNIGLNFCINFTETCSLGHKVSLRGECIYYRICENNVYITKKCPRPAIDYIDGKWSQQMFDPVREQCVDKHPVSIPGKCNAYKECIINKEVSPVERWIESYCAPSFHFDDLTHKCIRSSQLSCSN